jgi:hypothetical protein
MRNRQDRVSRGPAGLGWRCDWEFSRSLHLCDVFPWTARWLLRRALRQWPLGAAGGSSPQVTAAKPEVTFIIGHRGLDRLPPLLLTLEAVRSQQGVPIECVVVEQDSEPRTREKLPSWVRYHQAPLPGGETRYNRSAAFNAGSRLAQGALLILHDSDLILPRAYAAEAWQRYRSGFDVSQIGRFVFYLDQASSGKMMLGRLQTRGAVVERVVENFAGGSLAIGRSVFEDLGGMDEDFIGWGGEDNEFLERCLTRNAWRFGYMPLLHLWHPSLADRDAGRNPAIALHQQKRGLDVAERIRLQRERRGT